MIPFDDHVIDLMCAMANYFDLSVDNSYFPELPISLSAMDFEMEASNFTGPDWRTFGKTLKKTSKFFSSAEIEGLVSS